MATASSEQPLKKRRLFEPPPDQSAHSLGSSKKPENSVHPPATPSPPPPPTQEEILAKKRNRDEIRSVYENYKRIKSCIARRDKDGRHLSELEQAYLALITASGGCTSVRRILADFIPRYASYCPTALEAAARVIINMHNCSLDVITAGEDGDNIAFDTAKACIMGLVDICVAASSQAPTSSVFRGICCAVFKDVISCFVSSLREMNLVLDDDTLKMLECDVSSQELKIKYADGDETPIIKLSKLRALSLIRIFFRCPKHFLMVCFEHMKVSSTEGAEEELYIFRQITRGLDNIEQKDENGQFVSNSSGMGTEINDIMGTEINDIMGTEINDIANKSLVVGGGSDAGGECPDVKKCLLELVFYKYPSLVRWAFSKYKKASKLLASETLAEVSLVLDRVFESFKKVSSTEGSQIDSEDDEVNPSNFTGEQCFPSRISDQHAICNDHSRREKSGESSGADNLPGQYLTPHRSVIHGEGDHRVSANNPDSEHPRCMDRHDHGDFSCGRPSVPREMSSNQVLSPVPRSPLEARNNQFDSKKHFSNGDNSQASKVVDNSALPRVSAGGISNCLASPNHHFQAAHGSASSQSGWCSDGDPMAMGIFPASRNLWVGYLGPDVAEAHIRFQLERFGPIDQFSFFPSKGFSVVEYRNIIDAIRTREYIRNSFPWRIKFMDDGLGTINSMNNVAAGSSCYVYIENISNQWAKDEILHEARKALYRAPYMVTDLSFECALLMEFENPEAAASVMAHLRQFRRERSNHMPPYSTGPPNAAFSHFDGPRPIAGPLIHAEVRSNNPAILSSCSTELVSPNFKADKHPTGIPCGPQIQSGWSGSNKHEGGLSKADGYDSNTKMDPSQGAPLGHWTFKKPDMEPHSASGSMPPIGTPNHSVPPPQQTQARPFMRPVYHPPNSSWDPRAVGHHFPQNPISPGIGHGAFHGNAVPSPFVPASVTPLAQLQPQSQPPPLPHFDMFPHPVAPPPPPPPVRPPPLQLPFQPERQPPLPHSPPPLPQAQPPLVPPPPSSPPPPPPPVVEPMVVENSEQSAQYHWQGALCKSGVHYCTIHAHRLDSDLCKYSSSVSEPIEWPAKLDMTKRTDFRHVRSTFTNSPPHKREVCQLVPSSTADQKGDFISYLKQRECAGVIKVPASRSMWARLLFILPYSGETCSLLSVSTAVNPNTSLLALVLPKETNLEWM